MKRNIRITLLLLFFLIKVTAQNNINNDSIVWNVYDKYGSINAETLQEAINDAISLRNSKKNTTIVLKLNSGKYFLNKQININNMSSQGNGWLIIKGDGILKTELVDIEYKSNTDNTFEFNNSHRIKISDFTITGEKITSSQGTIVAVNKTPNGIFIDIDIDEGYPNINQLFDINSTKANKIRIFDDTNEVPHFIEGPNNDHYYYRWAFEGDINNKKKKNNGERPILIDKEKDIWRFKLKERDVNQKVIPFKVNQRIGISSKSNRSEWARFKNGGSNLIVKDINLLRLGRCKFRGGDWYNITFDNVKILRPTVNNKISFYSTDAGPQFGHDDKNYYIYNLIIKNCDFRGTVDDGSAFQKVKSGYAENNHWEDGGGVLVGKNTSKNFIFRNNIFIHCPLEDMRE